MGCPPSFGSRASVCRKPNGVELVLEPDSHPAVGPFKSALTQDGIPFTSFGVEDSEVRPLAISGAVDSGVVWVRTTIAFSTSGSGFAGQDSPSSSRRHAR